MALGKIIAASQHKRWQKKKYVVKFLTPSLESARAALCKLATFYALGLPFKIKTSANSPNISKE